MDIQAMDRLCDEFESRLRSEPGLTVEQFMVDVQTPSNAELLSELQKIQGELSGTDSIEAGGADDRTVIGDCSTSVPDGTRIPDRIGRYRIRKLIGSGGTGKVYLAEHPELKEFNTDGERVPARVVLKVCRRSSNPEEQEALANEASVLRTLRHENIARVEDLAFEGNQLHLVMEYVSGGSLRQKLKTGQLEIAAAISLVSKVARAVQEAHDAEILHRDLKPGNILLTEDGQPKVIDFGLSVYRRDGQELTIPGGTIPYMSPEQAESIQLAHIASNSRQIEDARVDIFSLGAILYELLTEKRLYQFDSRHEGLSLATECKFDATALNRDGIPEAVRIACLRALAKDRRERFRTARDFAAALDDALSPPATFRKPVSIGLAVVTALLVTMFVVWPLLNPDNDANRPTTPGVVGPGIEFPSVTSDTLAADRIQFTHFANHNEKRTDGTLFMNGPIREDDDLRVDVTFRDATYCFLIALNPDGSTQLCYPESDDQPQTEPIRELRYPGQSDEGFRFTDGAGQQAFLLVQSRSELPSFADWKQRILGGDPRFDTGESGRWLWREQKLQAWSTTRGNVRKLKGPESFSAICKRIEKHEDLNVYGVSFPVEKQ